MNLTLNKSRLVDDINIVSGCFFRTIEANSSHVAIVAHDGNGNNYLYVYDSVLNLLADKKVKIKKTDFSINTSKSTYDQRRILA